MKDKLKYFILKLLYFKRQYSYRAKTIKKIALLYYVPKSNESKYNKWEDGFTNGISLLENEFDVTWINLFDNKPTSEELNSYDFVLVKSCWGWIIDRYVRELKGLKVPRGIVVSCSKKPSGKSWLFYYDVVWFQTYWYKSLIKQHPNLVHAFGINSKDFTKQNIEKDIDVLGIGALTSYKRFDKFSEVEGKVKLVVGDTKMLDSDTVITSLKKQNVEVKSYTSQKELASLINRSKLVYLPCEIDGGGERAVLESRKCGVKVKVAEDNPKLQELLSSEIWDETHYGTQIGIGIRGLKCYK